MSRLKPPAIHAIDYLTYQQANDTIAVYKVATTWYVDCKHELHPSRNFQEAIFYAQKLAQERNK